MPSYSAPIKDQQFILHDVLRLQKCDIPGHSDLDPDFTAAILDEPGKLTGEVMAPLNIEGDQEGCPLAKAALDAMNSGTTDTPFIKPNSQWVTTI